VTRVSAEIGVEKVYNISVKGQPEFFANGILVHNCFEGPTGLLSVIPDGIIGEVNKSLPSVKLWNASVLRGFAGDTPERLRGPQHAAAWVDEYASFMYPDEALSNLRLGLRLGALPRLGWSTTPRPKQSLKQLIKETDVVVTASLYENRENLPDSFLDDILKYEGTKIGRQEIYGEIIDIEEMGVVKRSDWRLWPHDKLLPKFQFVIMSLDTATSEKTVDSKTHDPDYTACSVWGMFEHKLKRCMMLLDFWQERLGLNDLILKVKKERQYTYGDVDVPAFKNTAFGPLIKHNNFGRRIDVILIEQQGAGRPLIQMLASENILCYEYNPGRADKLQRLHMVSPLFVHGRVWAVESETRIGKPKQWAEETISQVCSYAGKGSLPHDDALDSATQALRYLMDNFSGPLTVEVRKDEPREVQLLVPEENPYSA
jgi:phage terminase large subunit-like protein